mgnify:CR=1 FL=1
MIRRPPRSTQSRSSAASDVYKRQGGDGAVESEGVADRDHRVADLGVLGITELQWLEPVSYTHLRAHETVLDLVCRLLLEKKNNLTIAHTV